MTPDRLPALVADLEAGSAVVVTLDLAAGRTIVLPPALLERGEDDALRLAGHGGSTPFARYADGSVPPYLLNVEVLS